MAITQTFVKSVNGIINNTGGDFGCMIPILRKDGEYELAAAPDSRHNHVFLDAGDIKYSGSDGLALPRVLEYLAQKVHPMEIEQSHWDANDYIVRFEDSAPYDPYNRTA